jgi:hypothetical protein
MIFSKATCLFLEVKKNCPFILLTSLEHAFKQGVDKNIGRVKIDMDFKVQEKFILNTNTNPAFAKINVQNSFKNSNGIGLDSIQKSCFKL